MIAEPKAAQKIWDVIVVGAGPGGGTCAWKCAAAGWQTLLLERATTLPRYKPCGGGIPAVIRQSVTGLEPEAFADLSVTKLRHSWKGKDPVLATMETTAGTPAEVWMVQRPRFDSWLTEKATQNGAMVRTGVRIVAITEERDHVTLTDAEGNTYTARYVVGADGAKGIIGPKSGLRLKRQYGIAREIEIPFEGGWEEGRWHPKLEPGAAYLDYGTVKHGYAWIFPKRNCLSVGAGMLLPKQPTPEAQREVGTTLRHAIDIVLHSVGLTYPEGENAPPLWAHPIPYWTGQEPLTTASGRTLLVGDAAGVVQPLFGEGIQYAVRSGAVAAEHLIAGTTTEYTEAIRALFAEEFDAAARVGKVFHRTPYLSYRLGVKNPAGNRLVGRVMAGEAHFAILEKRIYERLKKPFG